MSRFLEALHSGRVLLMDGAMGTELLRAGLALGECAEAWNLTDPQRVQAIHQAYADAGAEVLQTNTFQANWAALSCHGLHAAAVAIQRQGVDLLRAVTADRHFALYDVGPLNRSELPAAVWTPQLAEDLIHGLPGADAVLLETFSDTNVVCLARLLRRSSDLPVLISLTYERTPTRGVRTRDDREPEDWASLAAEIGVAALGVNCGLDIGMDEVIQIIQRYRQVTDLPLFARPNAGTPVRIDHRWVYPVMPQQMADRLPELLEAGVAMVGCCCGTTPEHIAAFRPVLNAWNAGRLAGQS
jgi:methionine synthase I (cobalamin-dependent)